MGLILIGGSFCLEWVFFEGSRFGFTISFFFDWISVMFFSTVLLISTCVMVFSVWYMGQRKFFSRFLGLICGFVLSIGILIFIPNLIILMVGWDGLGVISFLLVVFYEDNNSLGCGLITVLRNRVGDMFILMAMAFWLREF